MKIAPNRPELQDLVSVAKEAAEQASDICLSYFRTQVSIDYKGDESPVTVADCQTEQTLRDVISAHYPDHGIFGEEHGLHGLEQDYLWVLDPIDGTKSFITGHPMFGMLISILHEKQPILGMIHMPALEETFIGLKGETSSWNGTSIRPSLCSDLKQAHCLIGEADKLLSSRADIFHKLDQQTRLARFSYDCYSYGQLAAGHVDLVLERGLMPYDFCALIPVIEGAGAIITDWQGNPLTLESDGNVLACATPDLHRQALDLING